MDAGGISFPRRPVGQKKPHSNLVSSPHAESFEPMSNVSVRPGTCGAVTVDRRCFAQLELPSGAPEGGTCGGRSLDYAGCGAVAAVIRHGISSSIRLMGWPSAILLRMFLR